MQRSSAFACTVLLGLVFSSLSSQACKDRIHSEAPELTLSRKIFDNGKLPRLSHSGPDRFDSYLAMNIRLAPVESLLAQLSAIHKKSLKSRGEAHITVVTPLEFFDVLKSVGITIKELEDMAHKIQQTAFEVVCLGRGQAKVDGALEETFYIVVRSEALFELRRRIEALYLEKGGKVGGFRATDFHPHVTVGFSQRDLHIADGVKKDSASCWAEIRMVP